MSALKIHPVTRKIQREAVARWHSHHKPTIGETIALGANTDPYQPIEERYRLTRSVLEVCLEARHPVTITTKSARVVRDLDLLAELAKLNLTAVGVSVTSLDPKLSGLLEPRASSPAKRLDALEKGIEAGALTKMDFESFKVAVSANVEAQKITAKAMADRPAEQPKDNFDIAKFLNEQK